MNKKTKINICDIIVRATGIVFWFNLLSVMFTDRTFYEGMPFMIGSLIIGYIAHKERNFLNKD